MPRTIFSTKKVAKVEEEVEEPIFETREEALKFAKKNKPKSKGWFTKKAKSSNQPSNNKTKKVGIFRRLFKRTKKSVKLTSENNSGNRNNGNNRRNRSKKARSAWGSNVLPPEETLPVVKKPELVPAPEPELAPSPEQEIVEILPHSIPSKSYRKRSLTVFKKTIEKKIKHFWYRNWPDHGAPNLDNDKLRFVLLIDTLYDDIINDEGGTVIHCSAGVGRTGTVFVILKICLERQKTLSQLLLEIADRKANESEIVSQFEIDNAITYARMRRVLMVQSFDQYEFLLQLFGAENINLTNKDNFKDIGLSNVSQLDHNQEYGKACIKDNRYGNIIPYDDTIVIIGNNKKEDLENKNCDNYINANYLNKKANINCIEPVTYGTSGFEIEDMHTLCKDKTGIFNGTVIGAQGPIGFEYNKKYSTKSKTNTIQKFLRMLEENDIKRIVMLTGLMEKGDPKCDDYTSGNENTLTMFETQSYTDFGNFTEYTLKDDGTSTGNLILTDGELLTIKKKASKTLSIKGVTRGNSTTSPPSSPSTRRNLSGKKLSRKNLSGKYEHPFGAPEAEGDLAL